MTNEPFFSAEALGAGVEAMNRLGPRLTGSAGHNAFIRQLKQTVTDLGLPVYTDPYFFDRWEETGKGLVLHGETNETVHVSSAFPYSGETPPEGVTAPLTLVTEKHVGFLGARDKIAVVNVDELDFLPSTLAFHIRRRYPETAGIPEKYNGPVATSFVNFPFLQSAKTAGCKAVICIWRKMSDAMVEGQYLPFILPYQGIPALWVNETDGARVLLAAAEGRTATLTLTAERYPSAPTESFYTILPGSDPTEAVLVNTHTDGTNCIEENGPVAMLALLRALKDKPLRRTHIFLFATGHFRLPSFRSVAGGGVQATSKWLAAHPDLWDGKNGHKKAVACVSVEHLGAKMFKDTENGYVQTGDVETELVYTGNETLDRVYYEALEGRTKVNTVTLRGHNLLHFGEGQPPFNVGIPEISLVTAPDCLTVVSPSHETEKFDADLMAEQTSTFYKILTALEGLSAEEIGPCEGYSMVLPDGQPILLSRARKIVRRTLKKIEAITEE